MQSKTLSENIADRIKQRIIVGKYAVGTQLPNEQELADSLNVSRTTIREAVKLLVSRRVLEIERGKGTFVAAIPGLSEDPFGLEFVNEDILKSNLSQFRSIIEPEVCALAAANASAHQLDDMKHLVVRMNEISCLVVESSVDEWIDEFIDQEIAFHTSIYKMTHNVVFERMTNIISRSVIINSGQQLRQRRFKPHKHRKVLKSCDFRTFYYRLQLTPALWLCFPGALPALPYISCTHRRSFPYSTA